MRNTTTPPLIVAGATLLAAAALPARALEASTEARLQPRAVAATATRSVPGPLSQLLRDTSAAAQRRIEREIDVWQDHSSWDDPWIARTEHYEVRTTKSRLEALEVARGLETMLGHFQELLGSTYAPSPPQAVWIIPNLEHFNQIGNQHGNAETSVHAGYYALAHPQRPIIVLGEGNRIQLAMWSTHGAAEQFLNGAYAGRTTGLGPLWTGELLQPVLGLQLGRQRVATHPRREPLRAAGSTAT